MFKKAKPVYIANKSRTINFQSGYRCDFEGDIGKSYYILLTGSTYYKVYLNGIFLAYGPARSAHGYMRCDRIKLPVKQGKNRLAIEVAGYNCPSYYSIPVRSFVCAEVLCENNVIAYTGKDFCGIRLDTMRNTVCHKFSLQRPFGEIWHFDSNTALYNFKTSDSLKYDRVAEVSLTEDFIERDVFYPDYKITEASRFTESGRIEKRDASHIKELPLYSKISILKASYAVNDMPEFVPCELYGDFIPDNMERTSIKDNEYIIYSLPSVKSGFIKNKIKALADSEVYVFFAEHNYPNGMIFEAIGKTCSIVKYSLAKSDIPYELESFEPYSLKYIGIAVTKGEISFEKPSLRGYSYPEEKVHATELFCEDSELSDIFESARRTFCESNLDIYMDCPGRERGGWLCDSYFSAKAEYFFAEKNTVEKAFLENFLMAKEFPCLPDGMLPMVYPSEVTANDGGFIPQWAMWYVVELGEYIAERSCDEAKKYKELCYNLLSWFEQYENSDGLLEGLDGWNFIEWSKANDWVTGLNYPTNMLYCGMLRKMALIFQDESLDTRAERIRNLIIGQSFDGEFFHDHAERDKNGKLILLDDISETNQYYAMFFGIADKSDSRFAEFYKKMIYSFGPNRNAAIEYPNIAPSAPFIGNYLRLFVLLENKKFDILANNIRRYFGYMAKETGTLWEFPTLSRVGGSLCHGFASVAAMFTAYSLSGITRIDKKQKTIEADKNYISGIDHTFTLHTADGDITVSEKDSVKNITLPKTWKII